MPNANRAASSLPESDPHNCFCALYEQNVERVYRYHLARTGSPADAEDLTADGKLALYRLAVEDGLTLWDTVNNRVHARLEGGDADTRAAFSADGSRLVTAGRDGQLVVWDTFNGTKIRAMTVAARQSAPNQQIDALALSPNGLLAALAWVGDPVKDAETGYENMVRLDVWDLERGEQTAGVIRTASISALAWSPDGAKLAEAAGSAITLWDAALNKLDSMVGEPDWMVSGDAPVAPFGNINTLAFSPDGALLAAGGGLVTLYNLEEGLPILAFAGQRGPPRWMAPSWSGTWATGRCPRRASSPPPPRWPNHRSG